MNQSVTMHRTTRQTTRWRPDRVTSAAPSVRRRGPHFTTLIFLALAVAGSAGPRLAAAADLDPALDTIRDGNLPIDQRVRTVKHLLQDAGRGTIKQLLLQLGPDGDPDARRAIVGALKRSPIAILKKFDTALLDLLQTGDEALMGDVAAALARIANVEKSLRRIATDVNRPETVRRGAILALTGYRSRDAAQTMIALMDHKQPAPIRLAAFDGIRRLTGSFDLPDNPQLWMAWWKEHGSLERHEWQAMLLNNFASRTEQLIDHRKQLESRLVESLRREYLVRPQDQRPALLVQWLDDPVPATKRLAMDLFEQRLIDVQAPAISEDLRAAIRSHLDDPVAATRRRTAEALNGLRDEKAARIVAWRLGSGAEQNVQVLRAYLKLLRSVPRPDAVEPAMRLLGDPRLKNEAADVLSEAVGQGAVDGQRWLNAEQVADASQQVRRHLRGAEKPHPSMIRLLGRLAESDSRRDWKLIARYLDSESDSVKDAAALAWAESGQSLAPLSDRAHDPVIQPFLFDAIAQRGSQPDTLLRLIGHRPDTTSLRQAWERAALAMAGRVGADTVLRADQTLARDEQNTDLREKFLDVAIGRLVSGAGDQNGDSADGPNASPRPAHQEPVLIDILLKRAELHLDKGKPQLALATYQRLEARESDPLNEAQRVLCEYGRLRSHLALGDVSQAIERAGPMLASRPDAGDTVPVVDLLLDAAERSIEADHQGVARRISGLFQEQVIRDLTPAARQRLDRLQAQLRQGDRPAGAAPSDTSEPAGAAAPDDADGSTDSNES